MLKRPDEIVLRSAIAVKVTEDDMRPAGEE